MIVTTMNSTYEIDFAEERFRRVEGKHDPLLVPDGEWIQYVEAKRHEAVAGHVWFFVLNAGGYLRTSLVQSESVE